MLQSEMDDLYSENSLHWKAYAMDKLGTCKDFFASAWIWLLIHYPLGFCAVFMQIDGLLNIYEIKFFQN